MMHGTPEGEKKPMSDEGEKPQESGQVLEMPWVLISNQIQQLNTSLNERFNDVNARFNERFNDMNVRFNERFNDMNARFDDLKTRMDDMNTNLNHRMDGLESRLTNRVSLWVTVVVAVAAALLGFLFTHLRF